jgi:predicted dithiol-disulfide oxidoreductase (DUF899 family)
LSVFSKDDHDVIFHADSCDARGLVMLNAAYQHLDLVAGAMRRVSRPMAWVRLHDQYGG